MVGPGGRLCNGLDIVGMVVVEIMEGIVEIAVKVVTPEMVGIAEMVVMVGLLRTLTLVEITGTGRTVYRFQRRS